MKKFPSLCLLVVLFFSSISFNSAANNEITGIGIDEKLGSYLPPEIAFKDEKGSSAPLKNLITKPTAIALIYYRCGNVCMPLLEGIAETINVMKLEPEKDYSLLTVSIDGSDTPQMAMEKKNDCFKRLDQKFPENGWRFLTGTDDNIKRLTDAVGFRYKKDGDEFLHPVALIIISSDGKIVRYLYGKTFLPFDLKMALTEAAQGRIGSSMNRVLPLCFKYDPQGKRYVFNILRVYGVVMIVFLVVFIYFLTRKRKKSYIE